MSNKDFWNSLTMKNKTTGYSDYSVYYFDQLMRIKCLEIILLKLNLLNKNLILFDYGCGTGEISSYLSNYFKKIIAFDISNEVIKLATKFNNKDNITYSDKPPKEQSINVVVSITVLQHMTNEEIDFLLNSLVVDNSVPNGSYFIMLEQFINNKYDLPKLSHIYYRNIEEWSSVFLKHNWHLEEQNNFYNPYLNKTESYNIYEKRIIVYKYIYKLLRKIGLNYMMKKFKIIANDVLSQNNNIDGMNVNDSFSAFFVFKKHKI